MKLNINNKKSKCIICGNKNLKTIPLIHEVSRYDKKAYSLKKCSNCGLVRPEPLPYDDGGIDIYDSPDNIKFFNKKIGKIDEESYEYKYYFKHFKPFLDIIKKYSIKGNALDVGCGPGHMLHILKESGFNVEGTDISPVLVNVLKDRFKVYCGYLDNKKIKRNSYDLLTLNQVLEHVENPEKLVMEINSLLKNKGYVILAVPYLYGFIPQILRTKWYGLGYGQHLNFFSKKSLKILFERNGFKISEFRVLSVDYAHPKFPKMVNHIANLISHGLLVSLGLGDNLFIVARKVKDVKVKK